MENIFIDFFKPIGKRGFTLEKANDFLWGSASKLSSTEFARQLILFLRTADPQALSNLNTLHTVINFFIHGYIQDRLKKETLNSVSPSLSVLLSLNDKIQILQKVVQKDTFAEVQRIIFNHGSNKAYENFFKRELPDILAKGGGLDEMKVGLIDFQSKMNKDPAEIKMSNNSIGKGSAVIRRLEEMIDRLERTNIFARAFSALTGRAELTARKINALTILRDQLKEREDKLNNDSEYLKNQFEKRVNYSPVNQSLVEPMSLKNLLQKQRYSFFEKKTKSLEEIDSIEEIINKKSLH
ncbi:hypothetical protein ACQUW5_12575 [Legionella sp. CNM-1927-20]|uniref:hypothetical protein n=1 Tax=Legionella sp. CNM-1927-20 TaxID=3422221 RepID=UPI00403B009B